MNDKPSDEAQQSLSKWQERIQALHNVSLLFSDGVGIGAAGNRVGAKCCLPDQWRGLYPSRCCG